MATFGIDTSHWQGIYNFEKAKKEGVKYAILKLGGGDSGIYLDSQFNRSYTECKRIGLPVGAYFFGAALTTADAKKEANYVIDQLKGKQFEYPIFYDVEYAPMRNLGKTKLTNIVKAFCGELEKAGYWCGFYTNLDWYRNYLDGATLAARYSFWFAYWADAMYNLPNVQMWQKDAHTVAGVNTDSNYCFVDFPTLIKAKGKNGFSKPVETIEIIYQSFFNKWGAEISSKTNSYSGDSDHPISGIRAKTNVGKIYIQSCLLNTDKWLSKCDRYVKDGGAGTGYSGQMYNAIERVRVFVEGIDPTKVEYRAHWGGKNGEWGKWIKASASTKTSAGKRGVCMDGFQIRTVK